MSLTCAESNDAADGIVGRYSHRHAIAWNNLDSEAAHPAAQLSENFVPCITLNAIETSAVYCHDCSLHID